MKNNEWMNQQTEELKNELTNSWMNEENEWWRLLLHDRGKEHGQ